MATNLLLQRQKYFSQRCVARAFHSLSFSHIYNYRWICPRQAGGTCYIIVSLYRFRIRLLPVHGTRATRLLGKIFSAASRFPATVRASKQGRSGGKSLQTLSKIISNTVQNRGLEGGWAALGSLLGGSSAAPGSKAPLGRLWEAIYTILGRFLSRLGRLLGGFWAALGTKLERLGAF